MALSTLTVAFPYQASCVLVLFLLAYRLLFAWKRFQMKRSHGCQQIAQHPLNGFFSTEYDKRFSEAFKDGHVSKFVAKQFEVCGSSTYEVKDLKQHIVYTADPYNAQAIFTRLDDFHKEPKLGGRAFHRDGIMTQEGAAWRQSRDLLNPLFSRAELNELDHFEKFIDRMVALIPRDGSTVNLQPLLRKLVSTTYTMDVSIS